MHLDENGICHRGGKLGYLDVENHQLA